jgi:hypothetical protein
VPLHLTAIALHRRDRDAYEVISSRWSQTSCRRDAFLRATLGDGGRGGEGRGVGGGTEEDEKRSDGGGNAIGDREKFAAREIRREKADMATSTISNKGVQYFRRHELAPASLFTLSPLSGNAGKAPLFFPVPRSHISDVGVSLRTPRDVPLPVTLSFLNNSPPPSPAPPPSLSLSLSLSFSARSYLEIASVCLPRARGFRSKIRYPCTLYSCTFLTSSALESIESASANSERENACRLRLTLVDGRIGDTLFRNCRSSIPI